MVDGPTLVYCRRVKQKLAEIALLQDNRKDLKDN